MSEERRSKLIAQVSDDAKSDLLAQYTYISQHSPASAERLLDAFDMTVDQLCDFPHIGKPLELSAPSLWRLRSWAINGFRNHRIVYSVMGNELVVARVIHAAQDMERVMRQSGF